MNEQVDLLKIGQAARRAGRQLARVTSEQKNRALYAVADALDANTDRILAANRQDVEEARKNGLDPAMLDRLSLQGRLASIAKDVREVAKLPDPVGETFDEGELPNGLKISKRRTPLGVIGAIYEARPNATGDVAVVTL